MKEPNKKFYEIKTKATKLMLQHVLYNEKVGFNEEHKCDEFYVLGGNKPSLQEAKQEKSCSSYEKNTAIEHPKDLQQLENNYLK